MSLDSLECIKLDENSIEELKNQWVEIAEEKLNDAFLAGDIESQTDYAAKHLQTEKDFYVFGVWVKQVGYSAFFELSHVLPKAPSPYIKLLDVRLSPAFSVEESMGGLPMSLEMETMAFIFTSSLNKIFEEETRSDGFKVYCRTPEVREFYRALSVSPSFTVPLASLGLKARMEAQRWLVIEKI